MCFKRGEKTAVIKQKQWTEMGWSHWSRSNCCATTFKG